MFFSTVPYGVSRRSPQFQGSPDKKDNPSSSSAATQPPALPSGAEEGDSASFKPVKRTSFQRGVAGGSGILTSMLKTASNRLGIKPPAAVDASRKRTHFSDVTQGEQSEAEADETRRNVRKTRSRTASDASSSAAAAETKGKPKIRLPKGAQKARSRRPSTTLRATSRSSRSSFNDSTTSLTESQTLTLEKNLADAMRDRSQDSPMLDVHEPYPKSPARLRRQSSRNRPSLLSQATTSSQVGLGILNASPSNKSSSNKSLFVQAASDDEMSLPSSVDDRSVRPSMLNTPAISFALPKEEASPNPNQDRNPWNQEGSPQTSDFLSSDDGSDLISSDEASEAEPQPSLQETGGMAIPGGRPSAGASVKSQSGRNDFNKYGTVTTNDLLDTDEESYSDSYPSNRGASSRRHGGGNTMFEMEDPSHSRRVTRSASGRRGTQQDNPVNKYDMPDLHTRRLMPEEVAASFQSPRGSVLAHVLSDPESQDETLRPTIGSAHKERKAAQRKARAANLERTIQRKAEDLCERYELPRLRQYLNSILNAQYRELAALNRLPKADALSLEQQQVSAEELKVQTALRQTYQHKRGGGQTGGALQSKRAALEINAQQLAVRRRTLKQWTDSRRLLTQSTRERNEQNIPEAARAYAHKVLQEMALRLSRLPEATSEERVKIQNDLAKHFKTDELKVVFDVLNNAESLGRGKRKESPEAKAHQLLLDMKSKDAPPESLTKSSDTTLPKAALVVINLKEALERSEKANLLKGLSTKDAQTAAMSVLDRAISIREELKRNRKARKDVLDSMVNSEIL